MAGKKSITNLLKAWREGDQQAYEELVPMVYRELRRLAAGCLRDRPNQTLQPTALVHEAYLRLNQGTAPDCENRVHFFGIAACAMHDIMVEHTRKRVAAKRARPLSATANTPIDMDLENVLHVHISLERLASRDERKAKIIELRYFGGLSVSEVAECLQISVPTVVRDIRFAKAWLKQEMMSCPTTI
ncbi:MAG: ECF-type sigma factor [Acidobacteriaceae bacterium]|nr:ECF-type sigma factor [Acidobacteriaceae bacterium]